MVSSNQRHNQQSVTGKSAYYNHCPSYFKCAALPYESSVDAPPKPDLEKARQLLKEGGHDGRPIVVLDPTDSPYAHAPALVTAELLRKIGANVDLQAMDWSTMVARRANKSPVGQGGWNIFHTWAT